MRGRLHAFQASLEYCIAPGIEELLHVAEGPERRPDCTHQFRVNGVERPDRGDLEVKSAGIAAARARKAFIADEHCAGDHVGAILEQHDRPCPRVEAGSGIAKAAAVCGQVLQEEGALYVGDVSVDEAWGLVAHWEDANGWDFTSHGDDEYHVRWERVVLAIAGLFDRWVSASCFL
jgi:hypothetical protein